MHREPRLPQMPEKPTLVDFCKLRWAPASHVLQSAALARRNGYSDRIVMACLLHDISVHGLIRRASDFNTRRIEHLYRDPHDDPGTFRLHYGDMLDASALRRLLDEIRPDEVYNLAAQSHVRVSYHQPVYTADTVALGALRLLEAIREVDAKGIRYYQAGSSEMYGSAPAPQARLLQ